MVLDEILRSQRRQVEAQKKTISLQLLQKRVAKFKRKIYSLTETLTKPSKKPRLICEMKKASPSEGLIRREFNPVKILSEFKLGGADAISILTERKFFGGDPRYIKMIRSKTHKPILRKDFIIDDYQIYESKLMGADAILLIISILKPNELQNLSQLATYLGLEVLVEIHNEAELEIALKNNARLIGVNNRNLSTLQVNVAHATKMIQAIPRNIVKIVESGIESREDIERYKGLSVNGFLVGASLMRSRNIAEKIKTLKGLYNGTR